MGPQNSYLLQNNHTYMSKVTFGENPLSKEVWTYNKHFHCWEGFLGKFSFRYLGRSWDLDCSIFYGKNVESTVLCGFQFVMGRFYPNPDSFRPPLQTFGENRLSGDIFVPNLVQEAIYRSHSYSTNKMKLRYLFCVRKQRDETQNFSFCFKLENTDYVWSSQQVWNGMFWV